LREKKTYINKKLKARDQTPLRDRAGVKKNFANLKQLEYKDRKRPFIIIGLTITTPATKATKKYLQNSYTKKHLKPGTKRSLYTGLRLAKITTDSWLKEHRGRG
jgi:hypothetical protein